MCCRLPHMPRPKLCFHIPVMWRCGLVEDHVPDRHTPPTDHMESRLFYLIPARSPLSKVLLVIERILSLCVAQFDLLPCPPGRDRRDHFKVVGLKSLANTKKQSGRCFTIYLAFARHRIYLLKVHMCYTMVTGQIEPCIR